MSSLFTLELWHPEYNINHTDNLGCLPAEGAVFALFAMVEGRPVNCRHVGATADLCTSIRELFERPATTGLKKFMEGAWVKLLQYRLMDETAPGDRAVIRAEWERLYRPAIDENGEYPGYY